MKRNYGDMIILSSTYVSFESSASTPHFQYIHLPVCQLTVRVHWVRDYTNIWLLLLMAILGNPGVTHLTLCILMDFSFWFDTINLGWSVVHI